MEWAREIDGEFAPARPVAITEDGVQHPPGVFRLWSDADLADLGVFRMDRAPVPAGFFAAGWTYTRDGDRVTATPILEPIPPQQVNVTLEQLAALLAPPAEEGGGLVVGRWYAEGATVTVEGTDYEVTVPFLYADAAWTPATLAAHLVAIPETGPGGVPVWAPGLAVLAGEVYSYGGSDWAVITGHTTQAGWEPPAVPALWGPA
jgi:hypothetical protein